jgi:hypothetical protein
MLSGCDKLGIPLPWQKKEVIQIKIDGVPSTGKEPMLMIDDQLEPLTKPTYQLIKRARRVAMDQHTGTQLTLQNLSLL